jgi:hypothetical protein
MRRERDAGTVFRFRSVAASSGLGEAGGISGNLSEMLGFCKRVWEAGGGSNRVNTQ